MAKQQRDLEGTSTMSSHKDHAASGTRKVSLQPSRPNLITGVVQTTPTGPSLVERKRPVVEEGNVRPAAVLHENEPHAMHREDSMSSPSSLSYRNSSADNTESQDANPENDHGGATSDDNELVSDHAPTHSRQHTNPKAKETGSTLRKRERPVVKDPEDDSDTSTKQARHVKKPKAFRDTRATTKSMQRPWDHMPEHHYFFKGTVPDDWHIKNRNPRIYELDDLVEKDIKKLSYPIEIKVNRGEFAEMENWEDLQEYMEDRDIVPVCGTPATADLPEPNVAGPPLASATLPTPSTVHGEAIDPTPMPSSLSHDNIQTTRSDKTTSGDSEDRIPYRATHSKTAINIKKPQQSTTVALQAKFLEEVRLHASLAPDGAELYNNTPKVELQLSNFTNGVKQSLNNYHKALQQQPRLGMSNPDVPQDVHHGGSQCRATQTGAEKHHAGLPGSTKSLFKDKITPGFFSGMQKIHPVLAKKNPGGNTIKQLAPETSSASTLKKEADLDAALKDTIARLSNVASSDGSKSSKTRLHRCDYCKKPPTVPRLLKCQHVVCFECYSDAVDEAYTKRGTYPDCPTCGKSITEKPSLC